MDIKEVRQKRDKLQLDIQMMLSGFANETGVGISSVECHNDVIHLTDGEVVFVNVNKIKINLII